MMYCDALFKMDKLLSNDSYLNISFMSIYINEDVRPQCVICMKALAPKFMLPSKLKCHLETVQPTDVGKSREYFGRKLKYSIHLKFSAINQTLITSKALLDLKGGK